MATKRKPLFRNSITNYRNRHIKVNPRSSGRIKRKPTKAEALERDEKKRRLLLASLEQPEYKRPFWMTPLPSPDPVYEKEEPNLINEEIETTDPLKAVQEYLARENRTYNFVNRFDRGSSQQYPWLIDRVIRKQDQADDLDTRSQGVTVRSLLPSFRNLPASPGLRYLRYRYGQGPRREINTYQEQFGPITVYHPDPSEL